MTASAWVASAGLCLRTSSMTFSSASVSACEVDDVAATAARGGGGLRGGGRGRMLARRWGEACADAAAATEGSLAAVFARFWPRLGLGTTLRAIGLGFGSGTFSGVAQASPPTPTIPRQAPGMSPRSAVDRNAAARLDGVTAFLRGGSFNR